MDITAYFGESIKGNTVFFFSRLNLNLARSRRELVLSSLLSRLTSKYVLFLVSISFTLTLTSALSLIVGFVGVIVFDYLRCRLMSIVVYLVIGGVLIVVSLLLSHILRCRLVMIRARARAWLSSVPGVGVGVVVWTSLVCVMTLFSITLMVLI